VNRPGVAVLLALGVPVTDVSAQDKLKPPALSPADQLRVDEAIRKGVAFLKGQETTDPKGTHATELLCS